MFCNVANVPARLLKDRAKIGIPTLKAAYAEEGFYIGADQLDALGKYQEQGRSYCRYCCFVAISG
jgi:hypothetical protein